MAFESWTEKWKLTIQSSQVSGSHSNFPVLIDLTDSKFSSLKTALSNNALTNGDDILFADDDDSTQLDHEIESYDSGTGLLVAWVRVPSGVASTGDKTLYLYFGNSGASNQENATGVWDSNFKAVYHLHDDFLDSTSNNNDGTNSGSTDSSGKIADGQDFDGTDDYIDTNYNADLTTRTYSAWIRPDSFSSTSPRIITNSVSIVFIFDSSPRTKSINYSRVFSGDDGAWYSASQIFPDGSTRYHVAITYDQSSVSNDPVIYVDGTSVTVSEFTTPTGSPTTGANDYRIGNRGNATDRPFDGIIDEVRISNTIRSADWIATEYANQNSPSTFLGDPVETINLSGTLTSSGTLNMVYILPLLTGTLTSSGALNVLKVITQNVSGVLTSAGNLNIVTALIQNVSGTLTSSGAITEIKTVITLTLQGTLTSAGSLTTTVIKVITLNGTLTSSGALSSFFFKPLEKIRSIKSWILIRFFNDE